MLAPAKSAAPMSGNRYGGTVSEHCSQIFRLKLGPFQETAFCVVRKVWLSHHWLRSKTPNERQQGRRMGSHLGL